MNKSRFILCSILSFLFIISAFACSSALAERKNIILNPGFEYGNESWSVFSPNAKIDEKLSHSGKCSLYFGPYTEKFRTMSTKRYHIESEEYLCKVSYYNTSSDGAAMLRIRYVKKDGSAVYVNLPKLDLTEVNSWETAEYTVNIPDYDSPAETIQIYIYVGSTYPGDLWFDDFVLQPKMDSDK